MLVSNSLPATKTRSDWSFAYVPTVDPDAIADGLLVITEETGKVKRRTVSSSYGVQEEPARGCRSFLLVKDGHAGNLDIVAGREAAIRCGDVYRTVVATRRPSCTCPGFALGKRTCKHMIALAELVESADLPSPLCDTGADRSNVE